MSSAVTRRRAPGHAVLCLVALVLAGCANLFAGRALPCPEILILADGERLTKFSVGRGRDITDIVFEAGIVDFNGNCKHDDDEVKLTLKIDLAIELGPANFARAAAFSYFVAIPRFHPAPEGKRLFPVAVKFKETQSKVLFRDELTLSIPLKPGEVGADYDVYLGLQLTPDELEFNRRQRES